MTGGTGPAAVEMLVNNVWCMAVHGGTACFIRDGIIMLFSMAPTTGHGNVTVVTIDHLAKRAAAEGDLVEDVLVCTGGAECAVKVAFCTNKEGAAGMLAIDVAHMAVKTEGLRHPGHVVF